MHYKSHKTNLKHLSYAVLLSSGIMLSSCGKKAPKCSDREVIKTLKSIYVEQVINKIASPQDKIELDFREVRTQMFDKETGSYTCNATAYISNKIRPDLKERGIPIVYKTEIVDTGGYYVSVLES